MVTKNKIFVRKGKEMIAGKVAGTDLRGEGAVHRSVSGTLPRGLTAVEMEIWKLQQKEKNKK